MVDTYDLFKKLGAGAKFDFKRFKDDASKFMIKQNNIPIIQSTERRANISSALDFFGTKKMQFKELEMKSENGDNPKNDVNENDTCSVENTEPVQSKKKKRKKRKGEGIIDDNSNVDDGITFLTNGNTKQPTNKKVKKSITKEQLAEQHKERINLFRKEHRIHINGSDIPDPLTSFDDLNARFNLSSTLLRNLTEGGFPAPTPIQMQAISVMLGQREILACAPTGSGKTLSFIVPIMHALREPQKVGFRAVVVSPTRELAQQIYREFVRMNRDINLRIHVLTKSKAASNSFSTNSTVGGKFDILVTTPNRLVHMLEQDPPAIQLSKVEWLVLDEGDKLFEEGKAGFRDQVATIYQSCDLPTVRRCLFSATLANQVEEWCKLHLDNVVRVTVGQRNSATSTVDQSLMFVGQEGGKLLAVRQIIQQGLAPPVLVFVQSKERARELFNELIYDGLNVDVIHADRTQAQRDNVISCFRSGKIWILIATELMGRGIDFKGVNLVINYDFPTSAVSYVHRIGRTGRAGRKGRAITLFTEDDAMYLRTIANVMTASGCDVPDYMLKMKRADRNTRKKLEQVPTKRANIKTTANYDVENSKKRKQMIKDSKQKIKNKSAAPPG